jgi:dephospho-CoA kinase
MMIGLTGGIGSGKSTVAAILAEQGAMVIDADRVAHDVYLPDAPGHDLILERFGEAVLATDGTVDRVRLGSIVFDDEDALKDLNAIIHPLVRQEVAQRLLQVSAENSEAIVVVEAALMTETGWTGSSGASGNSGLVWTVIADPDVVIERLVDLRGMDPDDAWLRIKAQASNDQRRKFATTVIENNGSLEQLEIAVVQLWKSVVGVQADL